MKRVISSLLIATALVGSAIQPAAARDHRQLMKNGKLYSKLYNLNYASFDDIPEDVLEETTATQSAT